MSLSIELRHAFADFQLDVSFQTPPGLTVLFGESGSGKTSVINAVAGLLQADQGRIAVDDLLLFDSAQRLSLPTHRRRIGYVFQDARLFPHLSVRQNLLYGRWFAPAGEPRESFDRVVEMLGIGDLLKRRPGALSGGEKQRVGIGRALLASPRLILADEPLAALDEARKTEILPYFERLRDELQIPMLYVSHSLAEVARLATTVVAMRGGQVERAGSATEVLGDARIALGLKAAGAILTGRLLAHHADGLSELTTPSGSLFIRRVKAAPGSLLRVRIEAQDVILSRQRPEGLSAINILQAVVHEIHSHEGADAMVALRVGEETLLARVTRRSLAALALTPGCHCHAIMKSVALTDENLSSPLQLRYLS